MTDPFSPPGVATFTVTERFRGPARSGNGGYTAGALAGHALSGTDAPWPATTVRLHLPPPLEVPIVVDRQAEATIASYDGNVVAQASAGADPVAVAPVTVETAGAAEASYAGHGAHPFPGCFACGTGRDPGDGLRIFPGAVDDLDGRTRVAATWTPHPSLTAADDGRAPLPVLWAALDCAGAWAAGVDERPMVLGTMTARVAGLPSIGETHVVVGHDRGSDGRKTFTATSVYDSTGRLVGAAEHVWITVDPAAFN